MSGVGALRGEDGVARCPWAGGPGPMRDYHDTEWGTRVHGESAYLERLSLEAFQSGLSWATILNKRAAFREVFAGFEADRVAAFDHADVDRLMAETRIVRNRRKIEATVTNARATVALRGANVGGLEGLVLSFAPEVDPEPATTDEVPTTSPASQFAEQGAQAAGVRLRGPDHDARAAGGVGPARPAPGRLPPSRVARAPRTRGLASRP